MAEATDVFIAGTGPVGAAYARIILQTNPALRVTMADVGSQDGPVIGVHHKNSIKYQKDIDQFVNVIKGAIQPISIPPQDTLISNLGGQGWRPPEGEALIFHGSNPNQQPLLNLKGSGITRAVGGMGTHWTCNCPVPHENERRQLESVIPGDVLTGLLGEAGTLLNINDDQFDKSVRQIVVKKSLESFGDRVQKMALAVKRRTDNPDYVTWTGPDTILGDVVGNPNFKLLTEHLVVKVVISEGDPGMISGVSLRDLTKKENSERLVTAKAVILCCGAIPTPQILFNSGIRPDPLGRYLSEQSLTFCQVVLRQANIDAIPRGPPWGEFEPVGDAILKHIEDYQGDPLPIPFTDPDPQLMMTYSPERPWHVQIHHDAFSYGEIGPRADSRVVVDIRCFGPQEIQRDNRVTFPPQDLFRQWVPGIQDIYGMPQPTFEVRRSKSDHDNDQKMMAEMTQIADLLGSYLPGSYPQFMEPGLALHITGTTRIGTSANESVADANSKVHGFKNLWVGGNGCIPDATACNPTRTSVAIAIKGARAVLQYLRQ
ncbi:pyranose 2-oxidase [Boletus reticuloceps]|uniref:Pyranose 2-oxidase n=1 Tax=Boletus reticuloceps TaxID=495285 RepID=A0A8I2YYV3_9AGAM|nr:pyranose 2-oxidase [Boletus reticuloceps]